MSSVDCQGTSAAKAPVQLPVILQYLNVSWARNSITCRRLQNPYSTSISSGRTCEGGLHKSGKFRSTWIRSNLTHIYNVKGSSPSMELASFNEPALSRPLHIPHRLANRHIFVNQDDRCPDSNHHRSVTFPSNTSVRQPQLVLAYLGTTSRIPRTLVPLRNTEHVLATLLLLQSFSEKSYFRIIPHHGLLIPSCTVCACQESQRISHSRALRGLCSRPAGQLSLRPDVTHLIHCPLMDDRLSLLQYPDLSGSQILDAPVLPVRPCF